MNFDRTEIKEQARRLLYFSKPSPVSVAAVFVAVTWIISLITGQLLGTVYSVDAELLMKNYDLIAAAEFYPDKITPLFVALVLMILLISMVVSAGYSIYALRISHRVKAGCGDLFDCFGYWLRIIGLKLARFVRVYIWYLPLTICWAALGWLALDEPSFLRFLGVEELNLSPELAVTLFAVLIGAAVISFVSIAAIYKYRMSLYLMLDHPDWSIITCLRESRMLMRGRKRMLFRLDLSLLLVLLLSWFIPARVVTLPYTELCYCEFYNRLTGQTVPVQDGETVAEPGPWDD